MEALSIGLIILVLLTVILTSGHANTQRSEIAAKLDWIIMKQEDHETRLSVLEDRWLSLDEHPSRPRRQI